MTDRSAGAEIQLVPHTHWDREWYRPFQAFRMLLVDLVDRVLEMLEASPDFAFTLDGQLATVDDYLEIRPEAEQRIERFVREGRLAIGPWLILMDEFLVSGETIVRNLEMGWRRADDLGGPMRVGYLPDMFGHIAQMPQILRRAGLADAVVWRGVPASVDRHAFRWEAPDGSWVRAEYLSAGYGNAAHLFTLPDRLDVAADRFLEWARPWFGTERVLAMYGTDHMAPVPELTGLVGRLNELSDSARVEIGTLASYIANAGPLPEDAPCRRGELRAGARANLLMGVASHRIDIKQAAGRAERLLERYAEPLSALYLPASAWPEQFLRLAWRRVVENSAHDSVCGCSVDPVAAQVLVRYAEAEQIAESLARRAARGPAAEAPRGTAVVLNPSPAARTEVVDVELAIPGEWSDVSLELPDGQRIATQERTRKEPLLFEGTILGRDVDDLFRRFHGREIFDHAWNGYRFETGDPRRITFDVDTDPDPEWLDVEELKAEVMAAMRASADEAWQIRIVARPRRHIAAAVPAPALGWTAARAVQGRTEPTDAVRVEARSLDNARVSVHVADDGTLSLASADGSRADGVGRIVDGGDFGDSYNYAPPAEDRLVEEPTSVAVEALERGRLRGRLRVTRRYEWPVGVDPDGGSRSAGAVWTDVVTDLELRAGEPFVRVSVSFENRSDDHRVRFHIPLPRSAETSHAEGQFAVVERDLAPEAGHREEPLATYPAHGWVDAGGMAVLLDHAIEYELLRGAAAGGDGEIAITLLRSTGLISRNANPYRQEPAGPQLATPAAQLRGARRIGFALMPHAGDWRAASVARAAERYHHPFLTAPGSAPSNTPWPPSGAGAATLELDAEGVVLSELRRRDGNWLEARILNLTDQPASAVLHGDLTDARDADILGRPGAGVTVTNGDVQLELGPAEIRTLHLRRAEKAARPAELLGVVGPRDVA